MHSKYTPLKLIVGSNEQSGVLTGSNGQPDIVEPQMQRLRTSWLSLALILLNMVFAVNKAYLVIHHYTNDVHALGFRDKHVMQQMSYMVRKVYMIIKFDIALLFVTSL